jgi:hypothetical protein
VLEGFAMKQGKLQAATLWVALAVGAAALTPVLAARPAAADSMIISGGDRCDGGWRDQRWRDDSWRHDRRGRGNVFDRLDRNDDNRLSRSEFDRARGFKFGGGSRSWGPDRRRGPPPERDWYSSQGAWK